MDRAFAELLKEYRRAAGLTQEALAERAGLSVRSIQAIERGQSRPHRDTLRRLADALALGEGERTRLLAAGTPAPRRHPAGGVAADPPPLLSPPAPRHNLPQALSSLIGREAEQGAVLALLAEARLVTLTGSGGVGKTRLALAVAADLVDQYLDGVWLVELAALAEGRLVAQAVLETLGAREEPGRTHLATLTDHLQEKRLLLVLDNCEHLVGACAALVAAVLRRCPGLRVLATSREGLAVGGEQRYRVPSLTVPDPRHLPPPEITGSYEAVRLFVARAREQRADFALTPQNARAVAQVCARLDGISLAIELAAARMGSLAVEGIAARLDDRFRLLTGGARDALARQRTLRAALDWSYDLLTEPEQVLLDRLSVFGAGNWTLAAAEAICTEDGVEQARPGGSDDLAFARTQRVPGKSLDPHSRFLVAKWEVLDLLASLVNKSLVQAEHAGGEVRYRLLETVRQYGWERLAAGAELLRDRHLGWCLALAEEAEPHLTGPDQGRWLARLEAEHDNLRAALRWAQERGAAEQGLRLAGALWRFWETRGHFSEGRGWLGRVLAAGDHGSLAARAKALVGAGVLATSQGDHGQAAALLEESLALRRELGDRAGIASSLNGLGSVTFAQGDHRQAAALYEEALALRRELGDMRGIARSLGALGWVVGWQGNYARAATLHEEALALRRDLGDKQGTAVSLSNLGMVAQQQGDYARAAALHEEALALRRELGHKEGVAYSLLYLGMVAQQRGDYARAAALLEESLRLGRDLGGRDLVAEGLETLAWATAEPRRTARLGGAAESLRETLGVPLLPALRTGHEQAVQAMRAALGEEAFAAAWDEGRALPLEEAVALALVGYTDGG